MVSLLYNLPALTTPFHLYINRLSTALQPEISIISEYYRYQINKQTEISPNSPSKLINKTNTRSKSIGYPNTASAANFKHQNSNQNISDQDNDIASAKSNRKSHKKKYIKRKDQIERSNGP